MCIPKRHLKGDIIIMCTYICKNALVYVAQLQGNECMQVTHKNLEQHMYGTA